METAASPTVVEPIPAATPDASGQIAATVEAHGYAIVSDVIDPAACSALVAEIQLVEADYDITEGTNDFEGIETRRIFDLLSKTAMVRELTINPVVLNGIEAILGEDPLLSGTTSMNIGPSETDQLLHTDDGMITLPRPHIATMVTTLWALSEFRAENGATRLVPDSHRFDRGPRRDDTPETLTADMAPGSVLFLHGSTWHGAGANSTADERRFGLSIQYVAGWCRQQQNLMLGADLDQVATYPRRLQELLGFSLYRNVMGHVNRESPAKLLGVEEEPNMVWEKMDNTADPTTDSA